MREPDWQPTWKVYGYSSFEAYIESKAGACPPETAVPRAVSSDAQNTTGSGSGESDWPMPEPPPYPADDEGDAEPQP